MIRLLDGEVYCHNVGGGKRALGWCRGVMELELKKG